MSISFPIPADENQKNKIMSVIREVSGSKSRIEAERDYIKEALGELSKEHQIPKKILNKFATAYHKSNFSEVVGGNEEFEALTLALQPKAIVDDFQTGEDDE
jgi:uncharacterized FlgJ-related protein